MLHGVNCRDIRRQQYRKEGHWGDATLLDYWQMSALRFPAKVAAIDSHADSYTFSELDVASGSIANFLLETGVQPGDIVSFQLPNWVEFIAIYIACVKVGAVANPIITNYRFCELDFILNRCESKVLFVPNVYRNFDYIEMSDQLKDSVKSLKKIVAVEKSFSDPVLETTFRNIIRKYPSYVRQTYSSADGVAAILFTSGTESRPKGVMLTHNNILASENLFNIHFNLSYHDTMLMPGPVAHATGFLHGITSPMMTGAKTILQDIFRAKESVELMNAHQCTYMMGVTSYIHDIFESQEWQEHKPAALRFLLCGGAPIPGMMAQKAKKLGVKLISVYGSTESAPHTATCPGDEIQKIVSTGGAPLPGIEVKVVDSQRKTLKYGELGEEASRGPNVFLGYLKEPELTQKVLDEEGGTTVVTYVL